MAGNETTSTFFEALNDGYDAFIDGIRKANDRTHRFSAAFIEDAQRSQREVAELTRKWLDAPLDVQAAASRAVDAASKSQGRSLDVARQFLSELAEAQSEAQDVLRRMLTANRSAGEAAIDVARGAFSRAGEAVQSAGRGLNDTARSAVEDGKALGREAVRAGSSTVESNGGV
jgi:hypothetical protein